MKRNFSSTFVTSAQIRKISRHYYQEISKDNLNGSHQISSSLYFIFRFKANSRDFFSFNDFRVIFFDFPISNLFVAPLFTYSSSSSSLGCLLAITSFIIFFFQVVSFRCPIGFDDSSFFFVHFAFF